jgi:hypothetical protein
LEESLDLWLPWCLCTFKDRELSTSLGSQFIIRDLSLSEQYGHRVRVLVSKILEAIPMQKSCHTIPQPFWAKLAQNFITILLRFLSSSDIPSIGKKKKICYTECGL